MQNYNKNTEVLINNNDILNNHCDPFVAKILVLISKCALSFLNFILINFTKRIIKNSIFPEPKHKPKYKDCVFLKNFILFLIMIYLKN